MFNGEAYLVAFGCGRAGERGHGKLGTTSQDLCVVDYLMIPVKARGLVD